VKWICKMLHRMETQDEEFEGRIRALERLSGGESRRRAAALDDQRRGRGGGRRGRGSDCEGAGRGVRGRNHIILAGAPAATCGEPDIPPTGVRFYTANDTVLRSNLVPGRRGFSLIIN